MAKPTGEKLSMNLMNISRSAFRVKAFWFLCRHNPFFRLYSKIIGEKFSFSINNIDRRISSFYHEANGSPKFYVEIGANDGISQSNTKYLELYENWRGILIEPIPSVFQKLKKNRSAKNYFENSACCSFEYSSSEMSIIYANLMSITLDGQSDIVDRHEHAEIGATTLNSGDETYLLSVPAVTMNSILIKNSAPKRINFLSLDVEGSELEVLKGIDFSEFTIEFICVESRNFDLIDNFLVKKGYVFSEKLTSGITHSDYLFRHNSVRWPL
jgi:FkbM family methyltransferase